MKCRLIFICLQVTTIKTVKQMEDLVNLGDGAAWHQKWRIKLTTLFHQVISCEMCCCSWPFTPDITHFSITAPVTSIQATTGAFAVCLVTVWRPCLSLLLCHIWKGDPYADLSDPLSGAVFISSSLYTELKFSPQDMLKVRVCWWRFQGWGIFTKPSLERQEARASTWKQEIVGVYCDYWKILVLEWKVEVL